MKRIFIPIALVVMLTIATFVQNVIAITPSDPPTQASDVVGQPDFTSTVSSLERMDAPTGVAIDRVNHRMFVADGGNDRVLVYNMNSSNILTDKTPDFVIGQPDFETNGSARTQNGLDIEDGGLAFDEVNNRLFVSDESNARVMVFDTTTITNGMNASYVIGQPNFTANVSGGTASTFSYNESTPSYDPDRDWLILPVYSESRVLIFDVSPGNIANGMDASFVLGAPDVNSTGGGLSSTRFDLEYNGSVYDPDTKLFYLGDHNNHRVLVFDLTTVVDDEPAIHVLGQPDFVTGTQATSASGMNYPAGLALDVDQKALYVNDANNNRILIFDVNSITDGENAVGVIGQPDFVSSDELAASASSLRMTNATNLFYDETTDLLYVPEQSNNRVTIWGGALSDNDGIAPEVEEAGPNGGDANNDSIPDSEQGNVVSFPSPITGQYVVLEMDDECEIQSTGVQEESSLSAQDIAFNYPVGLMNFTADCGTPGFSANVRQFFYNLNNANFVIRKHNPSTGAFFTIDGATIEQQSIDGLQVVIGSYEVLDGGSLDIDGAANGIIVDPVGLGQSVLGAPRTGGGGTA